MNLKLVALMAIPFFGIRIAHMSSPSLWMATGLWLVAGVGVAVWIHYLRRTSIPIYGAVLVTAGALANGLVLLANDGLMPVHGMSPDLDSSVWRSADHGGNLLFLADRMSLGGASPGDLLVAAGLLFTFGVMLLRGGRNVARRLAPVRS